MVAVLAACGHCSTPLMVDDRSPLPRRRTHNWLQLGLWPWVCSLGITALGLQQAELSELAPQRLRHVLGARRGAVEIARNILGREIAPALERPPGPRLHQDKLRLQHEVAAADPVLVDKAAHVEEPLATHDRTPDHPVERAAVGELVGALGHHARPVQMLAREAALPAVLEPLADPALEILDRVTADAKLDEM